MSFLLKDTIHSVLAETIYNEILSQRSNYYYFIGRVIPWDDETTPETPRDTAEYEYLVREGIIAVKKIDVNSVSLVIPRIDWASGTVYDQYDGDYSTSNPADSGATSIKTARFYVLTTDFRVYKCLFNNNGAASTSVPTGTDPVPVTYADGYIWKYLYTVPLSLRNKFLTESYIPVQKQVTNKFYSNGQISAITIEDGGSGYTNANTTVSVIGDGTGVSLRPYVNGFGEVEDIIILNPGSGYTYLDIEVIGDGDNAAASVDFSTGDLDTVQATVELSAVNGSIEAFRINNPGSGYTTANITVTGDGTGFIGNVVLSNSNTISYIQVVDSGSGYTFANVIINGNGSNANVSAIISPYYGHGFNPVKELFADTIMFYSTIDNEKNHGLTVNNDYRQFGILKEIKKAGANQETFTATLGSACFLVTLDTTTGLTRDKILALSTDATRTFEVVEVSGNQVLLLNKTRAGAPVGTTLYDLETLDTYTISQVNETPDINKFTGDFLFVDNRTSVSYSDQQLVTLRTVIQL